MHAVVGVWTTASDRRESQLRDLREVIVPSVAVHPGFIAGYWMYDAETGKSHSTVVLDSEESARSLKALVVANTQAQARAGITADYLAIVDVVANAHR
jgi:hypothetical protein